MTTQVATTGTTTGDKYTIDHWEPENESFWQTTGKKIATRNLIFSVFAEFLAFSVWQVWSATTVNLPAIGFKFTEGQLFWLAAVPGIAGCLLRLPYAFMVPIMGGRNWTLVSTALLLLPAVGIGMAVQDVNTPYGLFLFLALLCGFGGGNFASSMANINFFYPKRVKGAALAINAAGGNIGVSVVQFITPAVIATSLFGTFGGDPQTWTKAGVTKQIWIQNAAYVWVPPIILALILTWFFQNNLKVAKADFWGQFTVLKNKHAWLMSVLYIGTFGSFIGYSAGFPLLIKTQFPGVDPLAYAFLGPLVGSLSRPVGGIVSDKIGGARVTFWNFLAMGCGVLGVLYFLAHKGEPFAFMGFFAAFMLLFVCAGIGNGSTYRMLPMIFIAKNKAEGEKEGLSQDQIMNRANKETGSVVGLSAAAGAFGAFLVPKSYGSSIELTGGPQAALYVFCAFYLVCVAITWWYYHRTHAEVHC